MRLIDADRLLRDEVMHLYYHLPNGDTAIPIVDIEHAPTIDAVEVTRCKDCKYQDKGENESESWNLCVFRPWLYVPTSDNHFCEYGERGEADDEKD